MATQKQTKAERRAAAQARADALRKAQQAKERRTRMFIIVGAVALVALIAIAAIMIVQQAAKDPIEKAQDKPAYSDAQGGFTVTQTGELASVGKDGQATGAKGVVVDVYYDYMCHWCAAFENIYLPEIDKLRAEGKVTLVLHPLNTQSSGPTSPSNLAALSAAEVADKDPEHFYAYHEGLFTWEFQQMGAPTDKLTIAKTGAVPYTAADLKSIAEAAGVNDAAIAALSSSEYVNWLDGTTLKAQNNEPKIKGTPAVYLRQAGKPFSAAQPWDPSYSDPSDLATAVADVAAGKTPPPVSTAIPVPETTPSVGQATPAATPEPTK